MLIDGIRELLLAHLSPFLSALCFNFKAGFVFSFFFISRPLALLKSDYCSFQHSLTHGQL